MKGKLSKEQIIIFAVIIGLVVVMIINFTSLSSSSDEPLDEKQLATSKLPEIPSNPNDTYSDRIEEAEAIRKAEARNQNIKLAQEEIQLDVFSTDKRTLPTTPKESQIKVEEPPISKPVSRKKNNSSNKVASTQNKVVPVIKEDTKDQEPIDPDLMFADDSFTDDSFTDSESQDHFDSNSISIPCVIQDEVTITSGSRVTIRTTESVEVDGKIIPKNTYIQAIASFNSQRVDLDIPPIKSSDGSTINKNFVALDANDNMPGLYSKELIGSDIQKDQSNSLIDEAANEVSSGILRSGIKSISRKKINEAKITIKRNQPLTIIIAER